MWRYWVTVPFIIVMVGCGGGSPASTNTAVEQGSDGGDGTAQAQEPVTLPDVTETSRPLPASEASLPIAQCESGRYLEGGRHYRVEMPSRVDGAAIVFEVYEPRHFDCRQKHPLILEGHGFSGSRQTGEAETITGFMTPVAQLVESGYTVISIDQRGHGESGGTVRVMDPDFAGNDLVQIVDWAEAHLDFLHYRDNNLSLGSVGGSYGGGFQYLLYAVDPDQRLDAMVPHITWHNLDFSLNPGNGVKGFWGLFLASAGDLNTGFSMDPLVRSTLQEGAATNHLPHDARDFLYYHSPAYFCGNERGLQLLDTHNTDDYVSDPLLQLLPITADGKSLVQKPVADLYPVDVLMFQGFRDSLFTFNEAYYNYQCMQKTGGDVRLLTYPHGHHYLAPNLGLIQETADNGEVFLGSFEQVSQGEIPLVAECGGTEVVSATLAWFDEKLRGTGDADNAIASGQDVCLSLTLGDSVTVSEVTVGGDTYPVQGPAGAPALAWSGLSGAVPTWVPLVELDRDAVLAGIPTADLTLDYGDLELEALCQEQTDPVSGLGSCDVILYAGIGVVRDGLEPELIDEQVIPLRGLGEHQRELHGIAERLRAGDKLYLALYGVHPTYVGSFSRDLLAGLVAVSGTVKLPLLSADSEAP